MLLIVLLCASVIVGVIFCDGGGGEAVATVIRAYTCAA